MKIIDLSHTVRNGMMLFPGDPEISISEGLTHEKDYCHVDRVHLNSHTGTHIDAPYHFLADGKSIDDYEVDKFIGMGVAIDLRYKKAGSMITVEDIESVDLEAGMSVVLVTGWCKFFGSKEYLNHPYISKEAAQYFVDKGISIVAVDFLNVDQTLVEAWDAHPVLLGSDVLIAENVANTDELKFDRKYLFSFLPLKIEKTDGSPIRAVAIDYM